MKIIQRYIIREFLESFFFGLAVFSGILLLDQVFQLINLFLSKGISFFIVLKLFLLAFPNILSLTIPMAALFGVLLAYGRLSEDNEITSMRSAGLSYGVFTLPLIIMLFSLSVFLAYYNQNLSPLTNSKFRGMYQEVLRRHPLVKFEEKAITNLGEYRIYAEKVEPQRLVGVSIYKFSPSEEGVPWRISAASATVSVSPEAAIFVMSSGYWQKPNPAEPETLVHLTFARYSFSIPLGGQVLPFSQSLREMSGSELRRQIKEYRQKKMSTTFFETEYWLRWTLAFAPFIFAVAGIPLGIVLERGGKSIGFGISLIFLFGYYVLLVTGINAAEKGYASPGIVLFLPDAVTLACGILLWRKMLRK
ncbi:MAG: hypothetical protein A2219_02440 [Elusimicrobia bacterium RIFOXYA2_FULL_50_26]|nr:MAG: hypothetical protein A2219_02440 [Elusimicrobia bacterium RIFOXYA2_FULL_50_26]OGS24068.1 MAG: hypothetical protein A2314_01505 [Elusimicrobia bacterium RIFOXYB2_FULL_50_12]